jgi:hypothetical protein
MSIPRVESVKEFIEKDYKGYLKLTKDIDVYGNDEGIFFKGSKLRYFTDKLIEIGARPDLKRFEMTFKVPREMVAELIVEILREVEINQYYWKMACKKHGVKQVNQSMPEYQDVLKSFKELVQLK